MLVGRGERRPLEEVEVIRVGERQHLGRPTVAPSAGSGQAPDRLYCALRAYGLVTVVDVSDLEKPVLLEQWVSEGNPGTIAVHGDVVAIPEGYGGLVLLPLRGR